MTALNFFENRKRAWVLVAGESNAHRGKLRALHVMGCDRFANGCAFLGEGGSRRAVGIRDSEGSGEIEQPCSRFERPVFAERGADDLPHLAGVAKRIGAGRESGGFRLRRCGGAAGEGPAFRSGFP